MAATGVPAGHHQVGDVLRVERPERDVVDVGQLGADERALVDVVEAAGRVLVEPPAADGDGVLEVAVEAHQVLLGEDVVPLDPPALALAGDHADPVHRPVRGLGELAAVLDVVPDPGDDRQQLEPDALVVADRVDRAAPLDPPVAVFERGDRPEPEVLLLDLPGPLRGRVRHRPAEVAGGEQDAAAQGLARRLGPGQRLAELLRDSWPQRIVAPASRASRLSPVQSR